MQDKEQFISYVSCRMIVQYTVHKYSTALCYSKKQLTSCAPWSTSWVTIARIRIVTYGKLDNSVSH